MFHLLMHCANGRCANLVYLEDSVAAADLDVPAGMPGEGRYCLACARTTGHLTAEDVELLHVLLIEAGLLGPVGPPAPEVAVEDIPAIVHHQGRFSLL